MKTEDQILAQLRASQSMGPPQTMPSQQGMPFLSEPPPATSVPSKLEEAFVAQPSATPDMEELHKLIQKDTLTAKPVSETNLENTEPQVVFSSNWNPFTFDVYYLT